jgi:Leucine-rich repeat (LRR) protein
MGRLDWLNHLSLIYNLTLGIPSLIPSCLPLKTEAFLNTLIENFTRLPLRPYREYEKQSTIKSITFKEIFFIFEHDFGKTLTWDQIMEKLMNFEVPSKGHKRGGSESPGSLDLNELVFISKKISSSSVDYDNEAEHRSQRLGDLRIPHTPPAFESLSFITGNFTPSPRGSQDLTTFTRASLRVPDFGDGLLSASMMKNETKLSLSCKKISILTQKLPSGLIELNLSHNHIERIPNLEDLEKLEFLNLNWNFVSSFNGARRVKSLKELYLAHNRIVEVESVAFCESVVVLDLAYNKIQGFLGINGLASAKNLRALDLEGNSVCHLNGFKEKITALMPQVYEFGRVGILKFTRYPQYLTKGKKKELKKSNSLKSKKHGK